MSLILIYSIHCLRKVRYHLYIRCHNWISPPSPSKCTRRSAILFYISVIIITLFGITFYTLQGIGYVQFGVIMDDNYPIDPAFPIIYQIAQYMLIVVSIGGLLSLSGYFQILSRLKDYLQQLSDNVIDEIIPCKYMLNTIIFAILLLPVCSYIIIMLYTRNDTR